ncbi:myelocytomatosis oncogene homolog [Pristis pectinata]|uniref:myelocytomatosis oncogene homolog n=1 Tax=Pristis pectinata TaxID=685728 RepID=UPI00223CFCCD|nr:myelocytomatosis oncogene homolog [Pristis pectinata]
MPLSAPAAREVELQLLLEGEALGWGRGCEDLLPTPPQSPKDQMLPSKAEQLELVSDLLLEDEDVGQSLLWGVEAGLAQDPVWGSLAQDPVWGSLAQDPVWGSLLAQTELDWLTDSLPVSGSLMAEIESQFFQALGGPVPRLSASPQPGVDDASLDSESPFPLDGLSSHSTDSDEEVDVVSVEKQSPVGRSDERVEVTPPATRSQTLPHINRCSLAIQQQHNYAAPSPLLPEDLPLPKRARTDGYLRTAKTTSSSPGPRAVGAEEERRRTHNVLEKQRRNELKHCLLALRDQLPELSTNTKASKVVILQKATEHIGRLQREQLKLQTDRNRLQRKQQQLRHKLQQLHRAAK